MAVEESGFFNAEYDADNDFWDRVYTAEQFASYFAKLISNGVFAGGLQVKQHSDETAAMDVRVTVGEAFINGYWYKLKENAYFNIDVNASTSVRTDCICIQYSFSDRKIRVVYHKDTNTPVRNGEMYELMICKIAVGSNVTSISQSAITDMRFNTAACGIVTGLIDQIDFDEAYSQFTTWFNEYKESIIDDFSEAGEMAQSIFNSWFEHMRGQLTTDAAGNLQLEIDSQAEMIADNYSPAKLYSVGDFITHENKMYKCIRAVTNYGEFNPQDWQETSVDEQIGNIKFESNVGENCTTNFLSDGSIVETYSNRIKTTVFNQDGSITETLTDLNGIAIARKTIVFNSDDSISETVTVL